MRAMIENFRIVPAGHCGSGSMRNLIYHYCGLDLEEGVVFGLGAGLDSVFFTHQQSDPPFMLFGRGSTMEADLARTLGLDYAEQIQPDNDLAWDEVKSEILQGRPTMLSGDIFYLDYRKFTVHFPAHRFVLLGFDDDKQEVYLADRINAFPETCSMEALRRSRNPSSAISTYNQYGKFSSGAVRHGFPQACEIALRITVERMLGLDQSQRKLMAALTSPDSICESGLAGLQTLQRQMQHWSQLDDSDAHARYVDNAIIKFGTGGGFFRNHFAIFMAWARTQRPDLVDVTALDLAEQAAAQWNALSPTLQSIVATSDARQLWTSAEQQLEDIYQTEHWLFNHLADGLL